MRKTKIKESHFSAKLQTCLLIILIISVVFICFLPTLNNGFVWDDYDNFVENLNYRGLSFSHLYWMLTTFHDGNYHPLAWLTAGVDFFFWDMNPAGYHLTNLVLHAFNAMLFYFLILTFLWQTTVATEDLLGMQIGAVVGALFFAVHPLRVEPVAWVSARGDLLCGFFYLLTIIAYVRMTEKRPGVERKRWFWLAFLFFLLSLLSRAWGITLPLVLLILDVYPLKRFDFTDCRTTSIGKILIEKIPFALFALGAAVTALLAKKTAMIKVTDHGIIDRFMQAVYGLCFYIWKTVIPIRLSPCYVLDKDIDFLAPKFILCTILVLCVTTGLILLRRRWPWAITAWICYVVVVSPQLGFVQSGPQIAADRYTYISCMPFAVLAGTGVHKLWAARQRERFFSLGLFSVMALIFSGLLVLVLLNYRQTRVWYDDFTFWSYALRVDPINYFAFNSRGYYCKEQRNPSDTLNDYNNAIRIKPEYEKAYFNRGNLLQELGDLESALKDYNTSIRLDSNHVRTYYNRGALLKKRGDLAGALSDYNTAIRMNPWHLKSYNNRGLLRKENGDFAGADKDFTTAIRLNPLLPELYYNRGLNRLSQNDFKSAAQDFAKALDVAPDNWPYRLPLEKILSDTRLKLEHKK